MATYSAGEAAVLLVPSLEDFQKRARELLRTVDVNCTVDLLPGDIADFAAQLEAELGKIHAEFQVEITADDLTRFRTELETRLDATNAEFAVDIVPEFGSDFAARVRAMGIARTPDGIPVEIVPEFASDFSARIRAIAIARGLSIPVEVEPIFPAGMQAQLDALAQAHNLHITVPVKVDHNGFGPLGSAADGARSRLTAMSMVRFGALFAGITALAGAVGGLIGLAGGAAAGLGAIGAAGVVGSTGVVSAFQSMKTASDTSTNTMNANAQAMRSAQQSLADAHQNAARTAVRGQEQLESAQRRTSAAERSAIQSRRDLSSAYKDAKRDIDDLNDSLRSQVLSEEEAKLAAADAYDAMQKSRTDGSSAREQQRAQLDYQRAVLTLEEQKKKTAELTTQTQEANTAGVEGAAQVLAAKEQVRDADQAAADAQEEFARTQRDVADANADAMQQVSRAQQGVDDALASSASASNDFADAMAKLSPNAQGFVTAMQALGPQWKELRMAVQDNLFAGLGDSVTTLANNQLPMLQTMLGSVATSLNGALTQTMSTLDGTLTSLTESGAFDQFAAGVGQALQGMAPLLSGVVVAMTELGNGVLPSLGPLFASLGGALQSMAPALGSLGASLAGALTDLMPHLAGFISELARGLAPVLPVLGELLASLGAALTPLIPPLSQILQVLGGALTQAITALQPAIGPLGEAFAALVTALAPILPLAADLISMIVQALAPALTTIFNAFAPVIKQLVEQLRPVFEQLAPILGQVAMLIADALMAALQELSPILPVLVDSFARIVMAVAPFLPQLLEITAQLLPKLAELFAEIVATWLPPLVSAFEWLARNVLPLVVTAVRDLADTWGERIESMSNYLRDARDFIGGAVDGIQGFFEGLGTAVSNVWDGIVKVIAKAVGKIGDILKDASEVPFPFPGKDGVGRVADSMLGWARANGYAYGGPVVGPGGPREDAILARLSNGEFVVNADATARHLPLLEAINGGDLPAFADGGRVALDRGIAQAQAYHGQAYDYGGYTGGVDCSLLASKVTAAVLGLDTNVRLFNTESDFDSMGWQPGLDLDGLSVGIMRGGGGPNSHMALTIGGVPAESSGRGVFYGPPAAGADDPQFDIHYFLPRNLWSPPDPGPAAADAAPAPRVSSTVGAGPDPLAPMRSGAGVAALPDYDSAFTPTAPGPTNGSGKDGSTSTSISGLFGDAAKAAVEGQLSDMFGVFGISDEVPPIAALGMGLARGDYRTPTDETGTGDKSGIPATPQQNPDAGGQWTVPDAAPAVTPQASDPAPTETGGVVYDPAGGAEQWRGLVQSVFARAGWATSPADVSATVDQIGIESGGDPNARNDWDVNAQNGDPSIGLLQVIRSTFSAFRSPEYPDDQTDPAANIFAAGNYVLTDPKYAGRGIAGVWPTRAGYAFGGRVSGPGGPRDDAIPAWLSNGEFVVNAEATSRNLPLLESINSGAARFASGGAVGSLAPAMAGAAASAGSVGVPNEYHTHYHVADMSEAIRREDLRRAQEMQAYLPYRR